jgi:EAL domain-containing protein (putative c-di-GMP-specific phosphodiesterase class I)
MVAKGIEHADQLEWLQDLGCPWGHGVLLSRPVAGMRLWLSQPSPSAVAESGN